MEDQNRFIPLAKDTETRTPSTGSKHNKFVSGLKFSSINVNGIRSKKLELLAYLDFHQPQIVAIQEIKIDSSIITSLPSQFVDIHSPDRLSDHDMVSRTLKVVIPPIKKPKRKVYRYQKGDYESMRKDTLKFAKEKYFNGHSDTRSVQENFNLIASLIQDSADKHIPSKTSRSVSSVPWITPEIRRKIRN